MSNEQGQPISQTPASTSGEPATEPAGSVAPELQQFVADPPAAEPAPQEGQPQGQAQQQTGVADPNATELLSLANRRQAEIYKLQQDNQRLQQQMMEALSRNQGQAPERNPYDPNTNYIEWDGWERQKWAKQISEETRRGVISELTSLAQRQAEINWSASHPNVDVGAVKAFAQMNGIADWNLDAAYRLMTIPVQMNQVAQFQAQTALNNFRQPQTGAQPVRGASATGSQVVGLSFEKLASEYDRTNGKAIESWPKEVQEAFKRELAGRYEAERR